MAQNEETLYFDNTHPEVRQESKDKTQNAADKATWKKVAVGGAAGILLGASAMYATDAFAASTEDTPDTKPEGENPSQDAAAANDNASIKVAESHDEQSFKEAFDAARAEVGPGGAFHWHGNIYSTYTEDEWNNMTDAEKKLLQAQHRLEEAQARDRVKERKARTRRLIQEGAILEKVLPEVRTMEPSVLEDYLMQKLPQHD